MILFLCYVFPPFAVLLMGRPFSAVGNFFLTSFGWVPGVKHALVVYADYKVDRSVQRVANAVDNPKWVQEKAKRRSQGGRRTQVEREVVVVYDNPHVGKGGTYFRPKN